MMINETIAPPVPLSEGEPMARHTSWRIGGPARYYAEVRGVEQARALARWARAAELPLIWVGGGTNLLVGEAGFPGLVARYRAQSWQIDQRGDTALLLVEAGAPLAGTARRVAAQGWAGLEWAEGVPGTVGGAVFGNAGCYGGDLAGLLASATLLVGDELQQWPAARLGYGYRRSALKDGAGQSAGQPPLILAAELQLRRGEPAELAARMAGIAAERKSKTPWGSSCGSVFKNPPGQSAGQLIELAGLKGQRIGGAEISARHANYIVNVDGASSADVLALIDLAQTAVRRNNGIELELEVRVL
jgi:UDP-N-acetylmuramate dehydrogenase